MAINKARTSPLMKAGVIILIVAFVGGIGVIGIGGLFPNGGTAGGPAGRNTTTVSTKTDQLKLFSENASAQITPNEQALKSRPTDYGLLKTLGDQYSDWARNVQLAAPDGGTDVPTWKRAADYYKRALAVQPGDPNVQTDMAIALYYSRDAKGAITAVEPVLKKNPDFALGQYNAGIFYRANRETQKAIAAFEAYLKLDPSGANAAQAKQFIGELRSPAAK